MSASRVVLFSRRRCPLCDAAREVLDARGVAFDEVDIGGDPRLEAEYGTAVPVVEVDGMAVFQGGMDPASLPELITEEERRAGLHGRRIP